MARSRLLVALLLTVTIVSPLAGSVLAADYSVSVQGAMDIPERTIETKYGAHTVDEMAVVGPDGSFTADVTAPDDEYYKVRLVNADEQLVSNRASRDGDGTYDFSLDGFDPGLYVVAVVNGSDDSDVYAVTPVVSRYYEADVDAPSSADPGDTVTVDVTLTEVESGSSVHHVEVVLGDDSESKVVTASETGEGTYQASVDTEQFDSGEYDLYAAVRGEMTDSGERDVLGVSDTATVSLEATTATTESGSNDSGDGGTSDPSSGTSGGAGTPTDADSETTATETSTSTETTTSAVSPSTSTVTETADTDTRTRTTETASSTRSATETERDTDTDTDGQGNATTATGVGSATPTTTTSATTPLLSPLGYLLVGLTGLAVVRTVRRRY